jgi:hypothetical protein
VVGDPDAQGGPLPGGHHERLVGDDHLGPGRVGVERTPVPERDDRADRFPEDTSQPRQ